ncbi:MAG: vWA domain-containing protein [Candidatus Methanospirareceae archaeon]
MSDIETRLRKARVRLLLDHPFFGTLALHLKFKEVTEETPILGIIIPTAATDGEYLYYNREWVSGLSDEELDFMIAHEVMHIALEHALRQGNRRKNKWNAACDYAINPILVDAGLSKPIGVLYEEKFKGMSAEKIYNLLPDEEYPEWDILLEPRDRKEQEKLKQWKAHVAKAITAAKMRGKLPAGIEELIKDILQPKLNWREILRRLIVANFKSDYTWIPPNKKHIWNGLTLPAMKSEGIGTVIIGVDTSASISDEELKQFFGEVQAILDTFDMELYVVQHDAAVQKYDVHYKGDVLNEVKVKGRGGTSHKPLFKWVEEQNLKPTCMICLTDAFSEFPDNPPSYPVLWAVTPKHGELPNWGEVVIIE